MRSSTDIFESEFTKEEWKLINDYFKYLKNELNFPSKPEITIGTARYPLGRFTIRKGLVEPFKKTLTTYRNKLDNPLKKEQVQQSIDALNHIQTITNELKQNGKTVKSDKRKNHS